MTPVLMLRILERLMKRSPNVVWRREIEQAARGDRPPGLPPLLHTVRGVGYPLKIPDGPA